MVLLNQRVEVVLAEDATLGRRLPVLEAGLALLVLHADKLGVALVAHGVAY